MNVVNLQDFAKLAEIETKQISVYLKRGKIIAHQIVGEGKSRVVTFNLEHPANKAFIESRLLMNGNKRPEAPGSVDDALQSIVDSEDGLSGLKPSSAETGDQNEEAAASQADVDPNRLSGYRLDLGLKRAELSLKLQKEQINDVVLLKQKRQLISKDVVGRAVAEVVHRYQASFVQLTDQLIRDTLNGIQADNTVITQAISQLTDIANEVGERAINEAKIAIINSSTDTISFSK